MYAVMPAPDYGVRGQAAAGIQIQPFRSTALRAVWIPACAGMTALY
jgi:hypothetical protein